LTGFPPLARQLAVPPVFLTEISLLVSQENVTVPVFDTTRIHAEAAVDYSLDER